MKQPWVYMCSPSRSPLPPPSPPAPSRSFQCTRSERLSHASNLGFSFSNVETKAEILKWFVRLLKDIAIKGLTCIYILQALNH